CVTSTCARSSFSNTDGCCARYFVRTISWVDTKSPLGHRERSSRKTWPPASCTRRVAQGSGTQAPSMPPFLNSVRVSAFAVGRTLTLPPCSRALRPLALSQARRATSWVLPSWGVASFLLAKSEGLDRLAAGRTTNCTPALVA